MTRLNREESLCKVRFDSELSANASKGDKLTDDDDDNICETAVPLIKGCDEDWVVHANRTRYITGQFRDLGVICLMISCIVACLVFYMICPKCLFGILIFCFILCPFYNSMNVPLWLAIILLTMSGWSLTAGKLSITWNSGLN